MGESSLGHMPTKDNWEFDDSVVDVFDDMLARSIPQHDVMRAACVDIGSKYFQDKTTVVDLGCSKGDALAAFFKRFGARGMYLGLEISDPMLEAAKERFAGLSSCGVVRIESRDLRNDFVLPPSSIILSVLTLMFIPVNYRQQVLARAYEALRPGGCLLLVEKVLGSGASIDKNMVSVYHASKRQNGYSDEEITRKALSLEGVLVPMTEGMNKDLLTNAGFKYVDCFWRWMNFCGWIAVK